MFVCQKKINELDINLTDTTVKEVPDVSVEDNGSGEAIVKINGQVVTTASSATKVYLHKVTLTIDSDSYIMEFISTSSYTGVEWAQIKEIAKANIKDWYETIGTHQLVRLDTDSFHNTTAYYINTDSDGKINKGMTVYTPTGESEAVISVLTHVITEI